MTIPGYDKCAAIFADAEKLHPDLMEPYATLLAGAQDAAERMKVMRDGLGDTFRRRYPMPEQYWSTPCTAEEIAAWDNYAAIVKDRARLAIERAGKAKTGAAA
jgi:hypothetical protein